MFICDKCSRDFKRKEDLSLHLKYCVGKVFCKNCGNQTYNPHFCSKSCSSSYNGKKKKLSLKTKRKISKSLGGDGIARCELPIKIKKQLPYFKQGLHKRKLILWWEQECKCAYCEYNKYDPINGPYEIHHIDGNNKNKERYNEVLICLNCHAMTDNYRFKGRKHTEETKRILSEKLSPCNSAE